MFQFSINFLALVPFVLLCICIGCLYWRVKRYRLVETGKSKGNADEELMIVILAVMSLITFPLGSYCLISVNELSDNEIGIVKDLQNNQLKTCQLGDRVWINAFNEKIERYVLEDNYTLQHPLKASESGLIYTLQVKAKVFFKFDQDIFIENFDSKIDYVKKVDDIVNKEYSGLVSELEKDYVLGNVRSLQYLLKIRINKALEKVGISVKEIYIYRIET